MDLGQILSGLSILILCLLNLRLLYKLSKPPTPEELKIAGDAIWSSNIDRKRLWSGLNAGIKAFQKSRW